MTPVNMRMNLEIILSGVVRKLSRIFAHISAKMPTRLQIAADMLMTTDYTITGIASRCGFGHMSYFARAFLGMFGVTPREYRNRRYE